MVDEVDQESFDVRPIMILICHNHDATIPQLFYILIIRANLKTKNLYEILNFWVVHDLLITSFSDIQEFTSEREDSIFVSSNQLNSSKCQTLG